MERGYVRRPQSMWSLETLGRQRLSPHFFMRDFLYSEIGNFHEIQNIPDTPELALKGGRMLCETILDPLTETFGRLGIRSGYRSARLNKYGNDNKLNCASNENPMEIHIWDLHTDHRHVAGASVVIPWFADQYAQGRDWRHLAWWLQDHLSFSDLWFFPKLCAFNIAWRLTNNMKVHSYIAPRGKLTAKSDPSTYQDFPPWRGIVYPIVPKP